MSNQKSKAEGLSVNHNLDCVKKVHKLIKDKIGDDVYYDVFMEFMKDQGIIDRKKIINKILGNIHNLFDDKYEYFKFDCFLSEEKYNYDVDDIIRYYYTINEKIYELIQEHGKKNNNFKLDLDKDIDVKYEYILTTINFKNEEYNVDLDI